MDQIERTCSFCGTRQSVPAMGTWGTGLACLDAQACQQRARTSGLYPQSESELSIAQREALAGAVPATRTGK